MLKVLFQNEDFVRSNQIPIFLLSDSLLAISIRKDYVPNAKGL